MLRPIRRPVIALAAAAALVAGCDSGDTPTDPSDPDTPGPTITETFSGTLSINAGQSFNFVATGAGDVLATLSAVTPEGAIVGLGLGEWNGSACQIVIPNDNASRGVTVRGAASTFGSLCVRIYDVGQLTEPAAFTITVVHP